MLIVRSTTLRVAVLSLGVGVQGCSNGPAISTESVDAAAPPPAVASPPSGMRLGFRSRCAIRSSSSGSGTKPTTTLAGGGTNSRRRRYVLSHSTARHPLVVYGCNEADAARTRRLELSSMRGNRLPITTSLGGNAESGRIAIYPKVSSLRQHIASAALGISIAFAVTMSASAQDTIRQNFDILSSGSGRLLRFADLSFDLAHVTKMMADEAFLAGDRAGATALYEEAHAALEQARSASRELARDIGLLHQDIDYRLGLLRAGFEFWGAMYSTRPGNPVAHLADLEEDQKKLWNAVEELFALEDALKTASRTVMEGMRDREKANFDTGIQVLKGQKAVIADQYHATRSSSLRFRIDRLVTLQKELYTRQSRALAEVEKTQKQMNALMLQGLGAAVGVPADVTNLANGGDIKAALTAAAGQLAGDPSFTSSLSRASDVAAGLAEVYTQGKAILDKAKTAVRTADQLRDVIRRPAFERLVALGGRLYAQADAQTQERIRGLIDHSKPLLPLMEFARSNDAFTEALREWLLNSPNLDTAGTVAAIVEANRDKFAVWYVATTRRIAALDISDRAVAEVFDQVLRNWTDSIIDALPPDAEKKLLRFLKIPDRAGLVLLLRQRGIEALPIRVSKGQITIPDLHATLDLSSLAARLDANKLIPIDDTSISNITRALQQLATHERHLLNDLMKQSPIVQLEKLLGKHLDVAPARSGEIFDAILAGTPDLGERARNYLSALQSGLIYAQEKSAGAEEIVKTAGRLVGQDAPGSTAQSEGIAALNEALAGPLSAVFPEAKLAAMAVQWAAGNFAILSKIEQINSISEQIQRYVVEEMHLRDAIDESEFRQEIAKQEQRIANLRREQAISYAEQQRQIIRSVVETEQELRERIVSKLRIGYVFYLAERIRHSFDSLNRALQHWTAAIGGQDFVRSAIMSDPGNLRLALDPSIRLFEWLEDKDAQRQRGDLDRLRTYWKNMTELAVTLCRQMRCTLDRPDIGQIDLTPEIRISEAVNQVEWEDFQKWQKSRSAEPFEISILLHPAGVGRYRQITREDHLGIRVVDVAATAVTPTGSESRARVALSHPGTAYIPVQSGYISETLSPSERTALDQIARLRLIDDYRLRWAKHGARGLAQLEGYGLFTVWTIRFEPVRENWELADLRLQFVYQYLPASGPRELSLRSEMLMSEGRPAIVIPGDRLVLMGAPADAQRKLAAWSTSKDLPWIHGQRIERRERWMDARNELAVGVKQWASK